MCGGGNPKKEHFVLKNGTLRLIFQEHFVLRIIFTDLFCLENEFAKRFRNLNYCLRLSIKRQFLFSKYFIVNSDVFP